MNVFVFPIAIIFAVGLAAISLSLFVLHRANTLVATAEQQVQACRQQCEAALRVIHDGREGLAAQIQEVHQQPAQTAVPAPPKSGLNLSKRSQALRMHRRGESPEQIAIALEIPLQEVDLLIKVHRIVLSTI
jgi:DNA-binding NarL/FixJ family response regulator